MGPLEGIRVLDMSMVVSGPFCTMMLGDLGADVIKIEPPEGDISRMLTGRERGGVTVSILNWNRNKRAMMLDLKQPGAAEVFLKMAERADVVVQNVRPGVVDRLGVGYDAVAARNPKIVYCSIAGYGFSGPSVNKPAYDPIIQGMAGVMTSQRTQGRPRAVKNILGDKVTAMTAAISILAALTEAQRSGKGQHLQIAMIDAVAYYLMPDTASRHTYLPHDAGIAAVDEHARAVSDGRRLHHDCAADRQALDGDSQGGWPSGMVRRRRAAAGPGAAIDQEPDYAVPDAAVGVLARADRGGRRSMRAGQRLRLDLERSAVRRQRDVFRIRASQGGTRARRAIARAILAHRARAVAPSRPTWDSIPTKFSASLDSAPVRFPS